MNIDEKTKIPLFAAICAMPFIIGGILWMASIDSRASEAKEQLIGVKEMLIDIHDRVIRIEEHLKGH